MNWHILDIRKQIANFVHSGVGGSKLLEVIAEGGQCAPLECDQLDYKRQINDDDLALAEICRDVTAFYNMYGGYIVVGVQEHENETFEIVGASRGFDIDRLKNKLKDVTGERLLVTQEECEWPLPGGEIVAIYILNIPSRNLNSPPISFIKDGPGKGLKGKRIFEKNDIPIRENDETTIARGAKVVEIWNAKKHPLLTGPVHISAPFSRISHNLPDRNVICPQVVGRKEALEHLWRWLPDDLSYVKVLAGEGGMGKSSIAYEFADQVSLLKDQLFSQVIWLSAKQRQFRPLTNSYSDVAETHFGTYDELLDRICDITAVTEAERDNADRPKKLRMIKSGLAVMPSLVVVDDIDSLEASEQRQALELGFVLSGSKTKLLLTTRNNILYSGDVCYTVPGIDKEEFPAFFEALMTRFPSPTRKTPKSADILRIWDASKGSPLFAESILRLLAFQNVGDAIGNWKGEAGDEVRKAALHREITQLAPESRRILLTLALLSEASVAELSEMTGYTSARVATGIQELSSLFLVDAPKLGNENRITVSETTGRLVLSMRKELAADHARLEKAIKDFRLAADAGHQRAPNKLVGAAILQASALEKQGKIPEALETLSYVLRKTAKGKRGDLLAYIGHLHLTSTPPNFDKAQQSCRDAYNDNCKKSRLFVTWFTAEWERGNFPGTEEIARTALDEGAEPIYEWRIRLAAALTSKAHAQGGGRLSVSILPTFIDASKELAEAIRIAPADEARKWRPNLEEINESIYRTGIEAVASVFDNFGVLRHLLAFIRNDDLRIRNYTRAIGHIEEILEAANAKTNKNKSQEAALRADFDELKTLVNERIERFPNDDRHILLLQRLNSLTNRLSGNPIKSLQSHIPLLTDIEKEKNSTPHAALRHEKLIDGVRVSSTSTEVHRPPLPDRLSTDPRSPHYSQEHFKWRVGIRFNGNERSDVLEYCISQGWISIPAKNKYDRRGQRLLIKLKGKVESYYAD
ncbi:DUF3297 family protein [Delftia tsuruhatensis]|uniref:DUF3297 family protein n=1 Tax=Delftia tsuruhatensis TaxID=180282 RepID=UPI00370C503B